MADTWATDSDLEDFLRWQYEVGTKREEIRSYVKKYFPSYGNSLSNIKIMLKHFDITKNDPVTNQELDSAIRKVWAKRGETCLGYRTMTKILRITGNCTVPECRVRCRLQALQPTEVEARRPHLKKNKRSNKPFSCKGPNYLFSCDGNDKLSGWQKSTFDIHIYGILDTYSRNIRVLYCGQTNNDPLVIGKLYLNYLDEERVLPRRVRFDGGTEVVELAVMQMCLLQRHGYEQLDENAHPDGAISGPSINNKIERFWLDLRIAVLDKYRSLFKRLADEGFYNRDCQRDRDLLAAIFIPCVQRELDEHMTIHNSSNIRYQRNLELPSGAAPDLMYHCPERFGDEDCGIPLLQQDIEEAKRQRNGAVYDTSLSIVVSQYVEDIVVEFLRVLPVDEGEMNISDIADGYKIMRRELQTRDG